jgi:hypothetical protein
VVLTASALFWPIGKLTNTCFGLENPDEGVPKQVAQVLPGHEVTTVPDAGWASVKNGRLLALIEEAGYRAFITCDKNMESQQPLHRRPFAILLLSTNHFPSMEPHAAAIAEAVDKAEPGIVTKVEWSVRGVTLSKIFRPIIAG